MGGAAGCAEKDASGAWEGGEQMPDVGEKESAAGRAIESGRRASGPDDDEERSRTGMMHELTLREGWPIGGWPS